MPVRARSRASSVDQERAAVVVDRAQLVELGVEAGRDHAAVAHLRRGLRRDRAREQRTPTADRRRARARASRRAAPSTSASAARDARAARRSVSRSPARSRGRAVRKRDARRDPLDVGGRGAARRERPARARRRRATRRSASCRAAAAPASRSGCVSQWRSRRLPAAVAHSSSSESSVGADSPRERRGDLEVAPRRRIEREILARASRRRACARARARPAASRARSASSAPAAPTASGASSMPKAARSSVPSCFASALLAAAAIELPRGQRAHRRRCAAQRRRLRILGDAAARPASMPFERAARFGERHFGERELRPTRD